MLALDVPAANVTAAGKAYAGPGVSGWNVTALINLTAASTGVASVKPITSISSSHHHFKCRDVVDPVIVTLNGDVVSWANNYDGKVPTTSFTDATPCKSTKMMIKRA